MKNTLDELKNEGLIEEEKKEEFKGDNNPSPTHFDDLSDASAVDSQKFAAFDQVDQMSCSPELNDIFNDERSDI